MGKSKLTLKNLQKKEAIKPPFFLLFALVIWNLSLI